MGQLCVPSARNEKKRVSPGWSTQGSNFGHLYLAFCLVLMLQVQNLPGACGWPLTGCQAAATSTSASCAARSWRTSGTTSTSTSPVGLNVLSVTRRTRVATTCARITSSSTRRQERSTLTISWPAHLRYQPATTPWTRSPKSGASTRSAFFATRDLFSACKRIVLDFSLRWKTLRMFHKRPGCAERRTQPTKRNIYKYMNQKRLYLYICQKKYEKDHSNKHNVYI